MFNLEQARKSGYTDEEIADHLAPTRKFDLAGAIKAGYSHKDVVEHLSNITQSEETTEVKKSEKSILEQHISNLPSSIYEVGKQMVSPETLKGVYEMAKTSIPGGRLLKWLTEGIRPEEQMIGESKALYDVIVDRYGSWENVKKTFAEKPAEFWMDVSGIMSGIGAGVSKIPQIARAGQIIGKAGQMIDPFAAVGKGIEFGIGKMKGPVSGTLGITTGIGKGSAEKMVESGSAFKQGMRGGISGEEVVGKAKEGVYAIREERGNLYRQRLSQIENMPNPPIMDIQPIRQKFDDLLINHGITRTQNGKLNFDKSPLRGDPKSVNDFVRMEEIIDDWSTMPGNRTPIDFDSLKKQLDNFYSESHLSRAAVTSIRNEVKSQLVNKVPEYKIMTKDYEKTTTLISEIEKDLTLGKKGTVDTAIRKLNQAMREDDNFRRSLIEKVESATGEDIQGLIAGRMANVWFPKTWMGREIAVGTVFGAILGRPEILPVLATASPRLMAETFSLLSMGRRAGQKIKSTGIVSQPARQVGFQTGRINSLSPQMEE